MFYVPSEQEAKGAYVSCFMFSSRGQEAKLRTKEGGKVSLGLDFPLFLRGGKERGKGIFTTTGCSLITYSTLLLVIVFKHPNHKYSCHQGTNPLFLLPYVAMPGSPVRPLW